MQTTEEENPGYGSHGSFLDIVDIGGRGGRGGEGEGRSLDKTIKLTDK